MPEIGNPSGRTLAADLIVGVRRKRRETKAVERVSRSSPSCYLASDLRNARNIQKLKAQVRERECRSSLYFCEVQRIAVKVRKALNKGGLSLL